jgi:archaeal flagellar protein FlaJ
MISSRYSPKLKEKGFFKQFALLEKKLFHSETSFNGDLLKGDLFCHLTYMAAIATSHLPRNLLFEYAAALPYNSSRYIRNVHNLAKKLNYDYAEACRIVGEATKEQDVKSILLKMAGSLASGENESDFLSREAAALGELYGNEYERSVESLRKWTDAYIALILSASLIVVISVVSMLIFPMPPSQIVTLTWLMLMTTVIGAWVMYRSSPKEIKTHSLPLTSACQTKANYLFKFVVIPVCLLVLFTMLLIKADLGQSMIILAVIILPVGLLTLFDNYRIDKLDSDIPSFLRSLGGVTKAIGTTVTEAFSRIDFRSVGSLKKDAMMLNTSLQLGIKPELCWRKFVSKTGSEHINRSVQIFWDGIAVGGDPEKVGQEASKFAMKIVLLRAKRKMISSSFSYTCMLIHGTIVLLLIGIYQVLLNFSRITQTMGDLSKDSMEALAQMPTFQFLQEGSSALQLLNMMVISMVIMLTIVNSSAIEIVEGGHKLKFLFYFGMLLLISGLGLILLPDTLKGVFSSISMSPQ